MNTRSILRNTGVVALAIGASFAAMMVPRAEETGPSVLSPEALKNASGEEIYTHVCQACHMPDARGAKGAGTYPALAENPNLASAQFTAATVYFGRRNMPHFGPQPEITGFEAFILVHLDDAQIARVVNYVRSHFGNHYTDELTAADVKALHP
ncbi:MAG TPA: cytochrome c [Rhodanobacteraceae bacterium]|jgi:mono/diheme cytochrome c family protein